MDDNLRIAAELARYVADAISAWQASEPDFAGDDEAWGEYEEALAALSAAYYRTTHSGLGLVSGELLAAALPSLAMRQWDAAAELAKAGVSYAEVEAKHIEQGSERYGYARMWRSLKNIGLARWYDADLAADVLPGLATRARAVAAVAEAAFDQWQATVDAPVEEWTEEPNRALILAQLADDCSALDAAGGFAHAARPPLEVLADATMTNLMRGSWATVYPFATATAMLAEHQLNLLEWLAVAATPHIAPDRRPYLTPVACREVIASPLHTEQQAEGRIRYWGWITPQGEEEPRILRVVTLEDGETIHTAFLDRNFLRKWRRSR